MKPYQADRVVRILTRLVSFVYYAAWVVAALFLVVAPTMKKWAPDLVVDPTPRLGFPVTLPEAGAAVVNTWDVGSREMDLWWETGVLVQPTSQLPGWYSPVTYLALVMSFVLVLLFLFQLRALFRRVREGLPFDAENATRMRWLGVWLLAFHLFNAGFLFWMSWNVTRDLVGRGIPVGPALDINWFAVLVALVLVGLAEVFRRGAVLEEDQSLMV